MTPRLRPLVLATLAVCGVAAAGCGKKSPPLAPLVIRPAATEDLQVVRVDDTVHIAFKVPDKNSDGKSPAALSRVDVYALTGEARDVDGVALTPVALLREATKVGSVEIEPPPPPAPDKDEQAAAEAPDAPAVPPPPPPDDPRPAQGEVTGVSEVVTPDVREKYVPKGKSKRKPIVRIRKPWDDWPLPLVPVVDEPLARIYVAVGRDLKGRPGALSARVAVALDETPPTPDAPTLRHTETAIVAEWTVPPTARRAVFESAPPPAAVAADTAPVAAPTPPGVDAAAAPAAPVVAGAPAPAPTSGAEAVAPEPPVATLEVMPRLLFPGPTPHTFNLYLVPPAAAAAAGTPAPATAGSASATAQPATPVVPLNPAPLSATTFADPALTFGTERCYVVRAVVARPNGRVEGASSPMACITPVDTFPPKAPLSLAAVGSEGAVNLIWEPNTERDLGGYIVLRGEAGGGALAAVTAAPIKETTFRDTNVTRGRRYVYAVVAVDTATPQNVSVESNRVEETVR